MPESNKHPITGCRMDTVMGEWLMDENHLRQLVDMGWTIVEAGELKTYSEKSQAMSEALKEKPYTVQDGIARLAISGPMTKHDTSMRSLFGGTSTMMLRDSLRDIRQRYSAGEIKAVFIDADSFGGTAEGTSEAAGAIRKTASMMPVFAHAEDKACSACLWVSTQASRFTCGPTASVGSLGTRMTIYDTSKTEQGKYTGKPIVIDTGKFKSIGHPGLPVTDEAKSELQRWINQLNEPFKQDVAKARGLSAKQLEEVATARIFVGDGAKAIGLVDAVCSADEAYAYACSVVNKTTPQPVRRGPGAGANHLDRARSTIMPTLLEQLRKLPGAQSATEDNALEMAINVANDLQTSVMAKQAAVTEQAAKITQLTTDLAAANAKIPKVIDPEVAAGLLGVATARVDLLEKAGTVTTAQARQIDALFQNPDKTANAVFFAKGADNKPHWERVLSVFEGNKPNGIVPEKTPGQPAAKVEPSADNPSATVPTMEVFNAERVKAGLDPLASEEFYKRFPTAKK